MKLPMTTDSTDHGGGSSSSRGEQLHGLQGRAFPLQPRRGWQVGVNVTVVKGFPQAWGAPYRVPRVSGLRRRCSRVVKGRTPSSMRMANLAATSGGVPGAPVFGLLTASLETVSPFARATSNGSNAKHSARTSSAGRRSGKASSEACVCGHPSLTGLFLFHELGRCPFFSGLLWVCPWACLWNGFATSSLKTFQAKPKHPFGIRHNARSSRFDRNPGVIPGLPHRVCTLR